MTWGQCGRLILQLVGIGRDDPQQLTVLVLVLIPGVFFYSTVNHSWSNILAADLEKKRGGAIKPRTLE